MHRGNIRRMATGAAVLAVAAVLTACSSSGSGSSSSGSSSGSSTGSSGSDVSTSSSIVFPSGGKPSCGATSTSDDPCKLPAAPPSGKSVKIGFFGVANNSYTDGAFAQAKKVASANNATIKDIRNPFDPAAELRQIQDALSAHQYDAYIVEPENPPALAPLFKQMIAQKLPLATFVLENGADETTGKPQLEGQTLSVVAPPTEIGQLAGQATVQACANRNPCNVGIVRGSPVLPFDTARLKGLTGELSKHSNIKVVDTVEGDYDARTARTATQNLLSAHGNVNVIASLADQMSTGVEQAITAAGKSTKNILITSMGAGATGVKAVRAGRWYATVLDLPGNEGYGCAVAVIAAARGTKISLGIDELSARGTIPLVLSKSNASQWSNFQGDWTGA